MGGAARWIRELSLKPHPEGGSYRTLLLGKEEGRCPQAMVPTGCWFASEVVSGGSFALVGCTVAPGFEFSDFELAGGGALGSAFPQHRNLIRRLTRSAAGITAKK